MKIKASLVVAYFKRGITECWGYVLGANGETYTKAKAEYWAKTRNKPSSWAGTKWAYFVDACSRWFGKMVADCSGGIVGAAREQDPSYKDRSANTFKAQFVESGPVGSIPEIPGLAVWRNGHIGIYLGSGKVGEFAGYKIGAVESDIKKPATGKKWTHWGKIAGFEYDTVAPGVIAKPTLIISKKLKRTAYRTNDVQVIALQERLAELGYAVGRIDGWFGSKTRDAVIAFQKKAFPANEDEWDGIVGRRTTEALGGAWQGK